MISLCFAVLECELVIYTLGCGLHLISDPIAASHSTVHTTGFAASHFNFHYILTLGDKNGDFSFFRLQLNPRLQHKLNNGETNQKINQ